MFGHKFWQKVLTHFLNLPFNEKGANLRPVFNEAQISIVSIDI